MIIANLVLTLLFLFANAHIQAYHPYRADIIFENRDTEVSGPNLVDLNRALRTTALEKIFPTYTPDSAIAININLRGLIANTSFADNSTTLVVEIPNSDITETFTGSTRDESLALFKEFIKEGSSVQKLLKGYTRYSPIDPIAGNPNSLLSRMAEADFSLGSLTPLKACSQCFCTQPSTHYFQGGFGYTRAFCKRFDTTAITLPLRYSYSPCDTYALIIDAPVEYLNNGGASSLNSSLGLGLRIPLNCKWALNSVFRVGYGGSLDLCTSGGFISLGASSIFNYNLCGYSFSMSNYVGYFSSTNLWLTGINFNYNLHNLIYKNGLSIVLCEGYSIFNRKFYVGASIKDTYFARERLFIKHYDEVVLSLSTIGINHCLNYDILSFELAYQWGEKDYNGYGLSLIYQF